MYEVDDEFYGAVHQAILAWKRITDIEELCDKDKEILKGSISLIIDSYDKDVEIEK